MPGHHNPCTYSFLPILVSSTPSPQSSFCTAVSHSSCPHPCTSPVSSSSSLPSLIQLLFAFSIAPSLCPQCLYRFLLHQLLDYLAFLCFCPSSVSASASFLQADPLQAEPCSVQGTSAIRQASLSWVSRNGQTDLHFEMYTYTIAEMITQIIPQNFFVQRAVRVMGK